MWRFVEDTTHTCMWIQLVEVKRRVTFARFLKLAWIRHWKEIVLAAEFKPFLWPHLIPSIKNLLPGWPHHSELQEHRLFPRRVKVVIRGQRQRSTRLELTCHRCDECLTLWFQQML